MVYQAQGDSISEKCAIDILLLLQSRGIVLGFEKAQQIPKRDYSLADLRLNKIETEKLLTPQNNTVNNTKSAMQVSIWQHLAASG